MEAKSTVPSSIKESIDEAFRELGIMTLTDDEDETENEKGGRELEEKEKETKVKEEQRKVKEEEQRKAMEAKKNIPVRKMAAPVVKPVKSDILMESPMPLVESVEDKLLINHKAMQILRSVNKPIVVVAIAGTYRTGKSYLLNRIAGKSNGFSLGAAIQAHTKGIWLWLIPHPMDNSKCMALLDTEGLADAEKGDPQHDANIFALAILLSSTLVYNSMGVIDQDALDKLHLMTCLTNHIAVDNQSAAEKSDADYDRYFPDFIWTLRDFCLDLVIDGRPVSSNQYMEHCLSVKKPTRKGNENAIKKFNSIRLKIREYFSKRDCFTFTRPTHKSKQLRFLHTLKDEELDEDFLVESQAFVHHIYTNSKVKLLDNGEQVNGSMLGSLLISYTNAINNGVVPCIMDSVEAMSIIENEKAVEKAFKFYMQTVLDTALLPTSIEHLSDIFTEANKGAVDVYIHSSIMDKGQTFQKKLGKKILEENENFMKFNKETSTLRCKDLLKKLSQTIDEKLLKGEYVRQGGFIEYNTDMENLKYQYRNNKEELGEMKAIALLDFMDERSLEVKNLMAADAHVTKIQAEIEEEKRKAEILKIKAEQAEKEAKDAAIKDREREVMFQENLKALHTKQEEDLERMEAHYKSLVDNLVAEKQRQSQEYQGNMGKMEAKLQKVEELRRATVAPKAKCFSSNSKVKIREGSLTFVRPLEELKIGDKVESFDPETNKITFSTVYFISHLNDLREYPLVVIATGSTQIKLDQNHLIYATTKDQDLKNLNHPKYPIRAGEVQVGDYLWVRKEDNETTIVPEKVIGICPTLREKVRHPMTMNHNIIVDGVRASVHMFNELLYRSLTFPLRAIYRVSPSVAKSPIVGKIVESWDRIEDNLFLPQVQK